MSTYSKSHVLTLIVLLMAGPQLAPAQTTNVTQLNVTGTTGSVTTPDVKVTGDGGVFYQKGSSSATPVSSGAGLYFYPYKSALILSSNFSATPLPGQVGDYSISIYNGLASGFGAIAAHSGVASGYGSIASLFGQASGYGAVALHNGQAPGENSLSLGIYSITSGYGAVSLGSYCTVSGAFAFTANLDNYATGDRSAAFGQNITAQSYGSFVVGRYNTLAGDPLTWVAADPLFVVGNGSDTGNRSDAFVVYKNGKIKMTRQGDVGMGRFTNVTADQ